MIRGIGKVFTSRTAAIAWATGVVVFAVTVIGAGERPAAAGNTDVAAQNDDQPTDAIGDPVSNQDVTNLKNAIDSIG